MNIIKYDGTFRGPGVYVEMPAEVYHSDPAPAPSLSNSLLQTLLTESPLHAWTQHPRLNVNLERNDERRFEIGSVAHKLALLAGAEVDILEYDSYRKKDAQAARDNATAAGRIPCLRKDYDRAEALAKHLQEAAEQYLGAPMEELLREVVVIWQVGDHWRRAMIDVMTPDLLALADLKSTEASAAPEPCKRRLYQMNYHIQAAWYLSAIDAHDKANIGRRTFGFINGEQSMPHAVSPPIEVSEAGLDMARQQIGIGSRMFDSCLANNRWPSYSSHPLIAEPPPWMLTQWMERQMSDETLNPVDSAARTGWNADGKLTGEQA